MGSPQKNIHQEPTKIKNPRRFTDEQIKSLESIFELETKLEPTKKLEIAKNLDLQPRQIAIWFQNRRARWKSKQTEHEYRVLKAKYDDLHTQFDDLKKENHSLHKQVLFFFSSSEELQFGLLSLIMFCLVFLTVAGSS